MRWGFALYGAGVVRPALRCGGVYRVGGSVGFDSSHAVSSAAMTTGFEFAYLATSSELRMALRMVSEL